MPVTAGGLISRATIILNDATNVRWARTELLDWLNDGQRQVVVYRPDASTVNSTMQCVSGTKQTLPNGGLRLMDVVRNIAGPAVRMISREVLDAQRPSWHIEPGNRIAQHWVLDPRDPRRFYVFPPATAETSLELVYSVPPADCASEEDALSVDEIYANAILDYMLFRAYSKDADYARNDARATTHFNQFVALLTGRTQADMAIMPEASSSNMVNPNVPRRG